MVVSLLDPGLWLLELVCLFWSGFLVTGLQHSGSNFWGFWGLVQDFKSHSDNSHTVGFRLWDSGTASWDDKIWGSWHCSFNYTLF